MWFKLTVLLALFAASFCNEDEFVALKSWGFDNETGDVPNCFSFKRTVTEQDKSKCKCCHDIEWQMAAIKYTAKDAPSKTHIGIVLENASQARNALFMICTCDGVVTNGNHTDVTRNINEDYFVLYDFGPPTEEMLAKAVNPLDLMPLLPVTKVLFGKKIPTAVELQQLIDSDEELKNTKGGELKCDLVK